MPIYEFVCKKCHEKSSFFVRNFEPPESPVCQVCGGSDLERCISRFAVCKTIKDVWERSGPPSAFPKDPDYYKDPRNIGRWTEKRLKDLGVDMDSEEYRDTFAGVKESIAAAREGELPKPLKELL
jgi:putative FmdB family regulatory protein